LKVVSRVAVNTVQNAVKLALRQPARRNKEGIVDA
jgi:hypothetical protein